MVVLDECLLVWFVGCQSGEPTTVSKPSGDGSASRPTPVEQPEEIEGRAGVAAPPPPQQHPEPRRAKGRMQSEESERAEDNVFQSSAK